MKNALRIFNALSDSTRLRIILLLLERDLCVCELLFVLKMSQSRISHQLRILRDAGLVEDKRDGQWMIYGIPARTKKSLGIMLRAFGLDDPSAAGEIATDRDNLRICLKRGIRPCQKKASSSAKESKDGNQDPRARMRPVP
jgi:ArsR family transcriptional regulator, arsenate/arsenite/antimonite-responsive transcriptional repressor